MIKTISGEDAYEVAKQRSTREDSKRAIDQLRDEDLSWLADSLRDDVQKSGKVFSNEQSYPIREYFGSTSQDVIDFLEQEFRKFVLLTLINPNQPYAPANALDMYWHAFILNTRQYHAFCDKYWGKYRHHDRVTDETRERMVDAYRATLTDYETVFGGLDPDLPLEDNILDPRQIWWGVNAGAHQKCILSA